MLGNFNPGDWADPLREFGSLDPPERGGQPLTKLGPITFNQSRLVMFERLFVADDQTVVLP